MDGIAKTHQSNTLYIDPCDLATKAVAELDAGPLARVAPPMLLHVLAKCFVAYTASACKRGAGLGRIHRGFVSFPAWLCQIVPMEGVTKPDLDGLSHAVLASPSQDETVNKTLELLKRARGTDIHLPESLLVRAAVSEEIMRVASIDRRLYSHLWDRFADHEINALVRYEPAARASSERRHMALYRYRVDLTRMLDTFRLICLRTALDKRTWIQLAYSQHVKSIIEDCDIDPDPWSLLVSADPNSGLRDPEDCQPYQALYGMWHHTCVALIAGVHLDLLCPRCAKVPQLLRECSYKENSESPRERQGWTCDACGFAFKRGADGWQRQELSAQETLERRRLRNALDKAKNRAEEPLDSRLDTFYRFIGHRPSWRNDGGHANCTAVRNSYQDLLIGGLLPKVAHEVREHILGSDPDDAGCAECYWSYRDYVADRCAWGYQHEPHVVAFRERVAATRELGQKLGALPVAVGRYLDQELTRMLPDRHKPPALSLDGMLARGHTGTTRPSPLKPFQGFNIRAGQHISITPPETERIAPDGEIIAVTCDLDRREASITVNVPDLADRDGVLVIQSVCGEEPPLLCLIASDLIDGIATITVTDVPDEISRITITDWHYY